jgi:MATE family multidrug resistance protein
MQDTMLLAAFGLFLPLWYFSRPLGNHGLWLSYLSFLAIRSLLMSGMFIHYSRQSLWDPNKT